MTQYDRINSGKSTAGQVAAEIKVAGAKKQTAYKRLAAHDFTDDFLIPFGVSITDCIREGKISPRSMYAFMHGEGPLDDYLAGKFSYLFNEDKQVFLDIQAKYN